MCRWVPGRHMTQKSGFSARLSEKEKDLLSHPRPCGFSPFSFCPPSFKCQAWNFLRDLISGSSYGVLASAIFASSPPILYLLSAALLCQGKSSPPRTDIQGGHPPQPLPLVLYLYYVTEHFKTHIHNLPWVAVLFPSGRLFVMKCTLNSTIHSPLPPVKDCGGYALHPVTGKLRQMADSTWPHPAP